MIRPISLYCYPVLLGISNTLNDKLESIQVRALKIISQSGHIQLQMDSLETIQKRRSVVDVFKSLNHIGAQLDSEIRFEGLVHKKKTLVEMDLLLNSQKSIRQLERNHLPIRGL